MILLGEASLRQVLSNLVNNAIKFTESGKVQVVISALRAESAKVTLRLEVFDTGIGIDDAALEMLFQRFVQLDASLSRRYGGTGLGLFISKQLVELMGGRIGASSRRDLGSQCWFELELEVEDDLAVAELVNGFTIQIFKSLPQFSAMGWFDVDKTLFLQVAYCAISTYLIIQ